MFFSCFVISIIFHTVWGKKCESNQYRVDGRIWGFYCVDCEYGYFCNSVGRQLCPEGYFCENGKRTPCNIGFYCKGGTEKPIHCDSQKGEICDQRKQIEPKILDSKGEFSGTKIRTDNRLDCPYSPVGLFCNERSQFQACPGGKLCDKCEILYKDLFGESSSYECPLGFYCPGTESLFFDENMDVSEMNIYDECVNDFYCPKLTQMKFICPPGTLCGHEGLMEPRICPSGHYCNEYGKRSSKKCTGDRYCPYMGMKEAFVCDEMCGQVSEDGMECNFERKDFPGLPDGLFWGSSSSSTDTNLIHEPGFFSRWKSLVLNLAQFTKVIGSNLIPFLANRMNIVIHEALGLGLLVGVFFVGGLFLFAGTVSLLPDLIPIIPFMRRSLAMAMFMFLAWFVCWAGGLFWWSSSFNPKGRTGMKFVGSDPFDIKVQVLEVTPDECFNLRIRMSLIPSRTIMEDSQNLQVNYYGKNEFFQGTSITIPGIQRRDTATVEFVLESKDDHNLDLLGERLLISFSPRDRSDCSYPFYFVPQGSLDDPEKNYISLKVHDVVRLYFDSLTRKIGGAKIGVIGAMGVGKTTTISLFGSMLTGKVDLRGKISNIGDDNTNAVVYEEFFIQKEEEEGSSLVFVDTFGLKDELKASDLEDLFGDEYRKKLNVINPRTKESYMLDFIFLLQSVYVRMFHLGYFRKGFKRIRFYEVMKNHFELVFSRCEDNVRATGSDLMGLVTEIIQELVETEYVFRKMITGDELERNAMDGSIYVTKSTGVTSTIDRQYEELRRYLNHHEERLSHLFLFQKKDKVCDGGITVPHNYLGTNPHEFFTGDVYLFRRKNEFSTDLNSAIILQKILKKVGRGKGKLQYGWENRKCPIDFRHRWLGAGISGFSAQEEAWWDVDRRNNMRWILVSVGVLVLLIVFFLGVNLMILWLKNLVFQKKMKKRKMKKRKKKKKKKKGKKGKKGKKKKKKKWGTRDEESSEESDEELRKRGKRKQKKKRIEIQEQNQRMKKKRKRTKKDDGTNFIN